ncbi:MAG TPA: FAD-dependent oxidoreductase [Candidatus Saccharimonadales bacterium]|nr:FAD-dependent oxidoreductase [Candidatus Saccharimonadales bacterium]
MKAYLEDSNQIMPGVVEFRFQPEQKIRFDAGQFIAVTIPHSNMDDRGDMREFSISSAPDDACIEITASYVSKKSSTYKSALLQLKRGDIVYLGEPMGDFVLPKDSSIPLIFVGAGIGVTPYKSIVKWLKSRGERRDIRLIYSASTPAGFLYEQLWRDYGVDYIRMLTRYSDGWNGLSGRLTPARIIKLANSFAAERQSSQNGLIYLAGPQSLIEPLFDGLLAAGIPRSQLLLDYFPGY